MRGNVSPAYAGVTLDELLSHRAGIPPYTAGSEYEHLPAFSGTVSEKRLQFAALILRETPVLPTSPALYAYSNAGYVLAALMLEQASGHSWEELVKRGFQEALASAQEAIFRSLTCYTSASSECPMSQISAQVHHSL